MSAKTRPSPPQPTGTALYWQVILRLSQGNGTFTLTDVEGQTSAKRQTVGNYILRLAKAGVLDVVATNGGTNGQAKVYRVVHPTSDPPKVSRDGTIIPQDSARDQMWRTAKIIKQFTPHDLAIQASTETQPITEQDAKDYCAFLRLSGYLAPMRPAKRGAQTVYCFLASKNTGPKAPMVQRIKVVFDPNLGEIVWASKGQKEQP